MKQNRRKFMKTQLMAGLGALSARDLLTENQAKEFSARAESFSPDTLRKHYQTCLGGAFPEPASLLPEIKETIRKDGYRIESITHLLCYKHGGSDA